MINKKMPTAVAGSISPYNTHNTISNFGSIYSEIKYLFWNNIFTEAVSLDCLQFWYVNIKIMILKKV